jgi:hypothetical protein
MKKLLILLIIPFFFASCKNEKPLEIIEKPKADTLKKIEIDSLENSKSEINPQNKLEAIEKENAETIKNEEAYVNKAIINKSDSLIWINVDMKHDHRIFGFEKPNVNSKKMILISIFTNDVENNPFNLPYGAFYDTHDMNGIELKFKENIGDFARIEMLNKNTKEIVYFEKKWLEFEQNE